MAAPGLTSSEALRRWRWEGLAWQTMRRVSRRHFDAVLRWTGGNRLPIDRARIAALGLPDDVVVAALDRVRSVN
jgi:hypothetical protein